MEQEARVEAPKSPREMEFGEGCPCPHYDGGVWGWSCVPSPYVFFIFEL